MPNQLSKGVVQAGAVNAVSGIGAFGVSAPTSQPASADQAAVIATAATSTTPFGYSEAQANAIVTLLNEIRSALVASGLIKGAA